nr:hypothetical protein [Tanacetum cinerariifolium]
MRGIRKGFSGRITPLFPTIVVQSQLGEGSTMLTDPHHTLAILQPSTSQPQKTHKPRKPKRNVTQVPQLSGGGPRCQEAMRDTIAQTRFENVSTYSNDSLLARGNTLQNDDDRLKLNELMELCTNLQTRVVDLEKAKTTQTNEIDSLKRRVKKLEKRNKLRTYKIKRLYKVGLTARVESSYNEESLDEDASKQMRIDEIDADEDITLVNVQVDAEMFDAEKDLGELKTLKPKAKGVVIQEPSESPTTTTTIPKQKSQDNGKGIMVEKPVKLKKKDQIRLDEEAALKLQDEFDEEQRLAREKAEKELEANIALIET